jgi:hypothetical protein
MLSKIRTSCNWRNYLLFREMSLRIQGKLFQFRVFGRDPSLSLFFFAHAIIKPRQVIPVPDIAEAAIAPGLLFRRAALPPGAKERLALDARI